MPYNSNSHSDESLYVVRQNRSRGVRNRLNKRSADGEEQPAKPTSANDKKRPTRNDDVCIARAAQNRRRPNFLIVSSFSFSYNSLRLRPWQPNYFHCYDTMKYYYSIVSLLLAVSGGDAFTTAPHIGQQQPQVASSTSLNASKDRNTLQWIFAGAMTGWTLATAPLPALAASDTIAAPIQQGKRTVLLIWLAGSLLGVYTFCRLMGQPTKFELPAIVVIVFKVMLWLTETCCFIPSSWNYE